MGKVNNTVNMGNDLYKHFFKCHHSPIALFKILLNNATDIVDYTLVDCNNKFLALTNSEIDKLKGQSIKQIVKSNEIPFIKAVRDALQTKTSVNIEQEFILKAKIQRLSFFPVNEDHFFLIVQDLITSNESQKIVQELQSRQKAILDNIPDLAWLKDKNNRYIAVNKPLILFIGLDEQDIVGKTDYDLWPEDIATRYVQDDLYVMQQGTRIQIEEPLINDKGQLFTLDTIKTPIFDTDGNIVGTAGIARDITERKQIENNLREIKFQLKAILDNVPDIAWLKDKESRFIAVNEALAKACNVNTSEMVGKTDLDFFPKELAEIYRNDDNEVVLNAKKKVVEEPFENNDGTIKVIETFKTPIFNENGEVIGTAGIAHDITERKKMEIALRESEIRFRELFENIHSKVVILAAMYKNNEYIIQDMNRNSEILMKCKKEEIKGVKLFDVVPPIENSPIHLALNIVVQTGQSQYVEPFYYEGVNFNGWLTAQIYMLPSKEVCIVYDDVTEIKEAESRLRLTQFSVEHSSLQVFWVGSKGDIYMVNKAVCETLGYIKEEIYSKKIWDINHNYTPEKWKDIFQNIKKNKTYRYESSHQKKSGESFPIEITANYIEFEGIEYNIAYVLDITERKKVEHQLAERQFDLERMVEVKTKELQHSLKRLENLNVILQEANNHKNKFLSSMSHELRTPLNAILGFSNALKLAYFGTLNEKQNEYIQLIVDSGVHLLSLIDDILDISKIDSGVTDIKLEVVDSSVITEEVISIMSLHFKDKGIHFNYIKPDNLSLIKIDSKKFKQILLNLLSNALKFTNPGGSVTVILNNKFDTTIKISVIDTGMGIAPEEQNKIFDEFYQTDEVRKKAIGGTGIGLALTKRLVQMHNGEIGVISQLQKGSEFWFTIPKEDE